MTERGGCGWEVKGGRRAEIDAAKGEGERENRGDGRESGSSPNRPPLPPGV